MGRKAWGGKRFVRKAKTLECYHNVKQAGFCDESEEESFCRICFDTGPVLVPGCLANSKDKEELVQPCGCLGSMSYVHPSCLHKWRSLCAGAAKNRCGVCLQPYTYPLSPVNRWQQLASLLPTFLSLLCICLVTCGATAMPQWPRLIIGSIALVVLARCQSVTNLVLLLLLSSMLGLYIRGLQLVAQGDGCGRVCLSLSNNRQTLHRPCLPDSGGALGAALRKQQQHSHQRQQQEQEDAQGEALEWRWPDSSTIEEELFDVAGPGGCGDEEWAEEATGSAHESVPAGGSDGAAVAGHCGSLSDGCGGASGLSDYVWPKSMMLRWGWLW